MTAISTLDPVTVKILWDRLVSIVDEATMAQYRTAFSTVVREANDFACSILDIRGGTLANSQFGLPSFVGTQAITLQHMLRIFPLETIQPGDVLITNDPWIGTGQALDITLLSPIFRNGKVVAFAGSVAHSPELGGAQRWNRSVDVFEEALRILPMKLYHAGRRDETLYALIRDNSRLPDLTIGDLESQLSAIYLATTRLLEMMDEYGLADLEELASEIYSRSEGAMRAAIQTIPDGVYVGEIWSEGFPDPLIDGELPPPEPIRIRATVTVEGSDLLVDFTGSSPEQPGSFNSVWTFSTAYGAYAIRTILVPLLPNNAGFYRPLKIICPEATVVNARFPSPTLSRHVLGHQVCDAIFAALAPAIPDRVIAPSGSSPVWDLLLMGDDQDGRPFHRLILINGGGGASSAQDGYTLAFPGNYSNTPVEIMEALMPVVWECKEAVIDSAGAGRRRGGFGQRMVCRGLKGFGYSLLNARVDFPPPGLFGGRPGRPGAAYARARAIRPGSDGQLAVEERLILETPGGGGLGSPLEREPDRVLNDVREGLVSLSAAESIYGVVIDPQTMQVDWPATAARRAGGEEQG